MKTFIQVVKKRTVASIALNDVLSYQNRVYIPNLLYSNKNKRQISNVKRYLSDAPYQAIPTKYDNTIAAYNMFELLSKHMGYSDAKNISVIWNKNNRKNYGW